MKRAAVCLLAIFITYMTTYASADPLEPMLLDKCQSIAEASYECGSLSKTQVIARGATAEIKTLYADKQTYPITVAAEDQYGDLTHYCVDQKCTCEESVKYVVVAGNGKGVYAINTRERENSELYQRCNFDYAYIQREPRYIYTSSKVVSTAIYELVFGRTSNGSCHGGIKLTTYDVNSGKPYLLGDVISKKDLAKLKAELSATFAAKHSTTAKNIADTITDQSGIYIENNNIYVNLDSFILGCADGSFFPIPIPQNLILPEFLENLQL